MPEANAELLRGGWYHSGDLGRLDEAGNLYFVDRPRRRYHVIPQNLTAHRQVQTVTRSRHTSGGLGLRPL